MNLEKPQMFNDDLIGNLPMRNMLIHSIQFDHLHHALLFYGPSGIGKFTTALNLAKALNCHRKTKTWCSECDACRRLQPPFPFHPDLKVFRNIQTPVFLFRDVLIDRFEVDYRKGHIDSRNALLSAYSSCLNNLETGGFLTKRISSSETERPMDIIFFNKEIRIKTQVFEKISNHPLSFWLLKKMHIYQESACYFRTIKIEQIRQLQKEFHYHPFEGKYKIVIIDNADKMLIPAQNSLLKTLEEPTGHALLILITSNPTALLPTIRSRCQAIPFYSLSANDLRRILSDRFGYHTEKADRISNMAEGSVDRALLKDWEVFRQKQQKFEKLFQDCQGGSMAAWAIRAADVIMEQSESALEEDVLTDFYLWLHQKLQTTVDDSGNYARESIPLSQVVFLHLFEETSRIMDIGKFHPDIRLQLESMFFKVMSHNSQRILR